MNTFKKYHSLGIFLAYTVVLGFKTPYYHDAVILLVLAAYIALSFYIQYTELPDIRKDVDARITVMQMQYDEMVKGLAVKHESDLKKLDNDYKEIRSKISAIGSTKAVGMNNTRF